jgi:hypothetical protein
MDYIPTLPPLSAWQRLQGSSPFLPEPVSAVPLVAECLSMPAAGPVSSDLEDYSQQPSVTAFESEHLSQEFWRRSDDAYGWRLSIALDAIARIEAQPGLTMWLETHAPNLYGKLTGDLPDAIKGAWENRAPLPVFEEQCARLVETYQLAATLYRPAYESNARDIEVKNMSANEGWRSAPKLLS